MRDWTIVLSLYVTVLMGCATSRNDADGGDAGECIPTVAPQPTNCGDAGACSALAVEGDSYASSPSFRGFADPTLHGDPDVPGRIWLAYSWPFAAPGVAPDGGAVMVAAVETHLAWSA